MSAAGPDGLGGTSGTRAAEPGLPNASPPVAPVPPRPSEPTVGSPEWQVARAKWLQERDERVAAERDWRLREKLAKDEEIRQHRAAAAARNRWLDAGRVEY